MALFEWATESLVRTIRSKRGFIQKLTRNVQQFCCGFKGNMFFCKIEQKHIILCLKSNTISTSLFTEVL